MDVGACKRAATAFDTDFVRLACLHGGRHAASLPDAREVLSWPDAAGSPRCAAGERGVRGSAAQPLGHCRCGAHSRGRLIRLDNK